MFEGLPLLPSDPILGLSVAFRDDPNPNKVDLGVGVYRNDVGETPIMAAVRAAEQERLRREPTQGYTVARVSRREGASRGGRPAQALLSRRPDRGHERGVPRARARHTDPQSPRAA